LIFMNARYKETSMRNENRTRTTRRLLSPSV